MGGMPSVGVFLRDPSPYLREFRRKPQPKDGETGRINSMFIDMVHHKNFIGVESRKKIFAMPHIVSCVQPQKTKGIGGMFCFEGIKFPVKNNFICT